MRYFKQKTKNTTEKYTYKNLTKEQKRAHRRKKFWDSLSTVTVLFCIIASFSALGVMIDMIETNSESIIVEAINSFAKGLLFTLAFTLSCVIGGLSSIPFSKIARKYSVDFTREELVKSCEHLREYYGLCEPCIVTKCYNSSEKRFNNHDVCIFVVDDELRITTNLKDGFFHSEKDLGCYCFKADEITVSKEQGERFLVAKLSSNDLYFELGYRAKGFIESNFLQKQE